METFATLLGLIAVCIGLAALAQRLRVPLAVPLILGGMVLAFVPGLPTIELDPELALALFLPPLLQLCAYRTDWPAFKANLRPILLLAIGAVFFTAAAVACVAHWIVPNLPWWAAIALGAIVAPPDAVAASSVLKRFSLPKRLVVVLEGESLINDASSLVLYRFAVAAVASGSVSYAAGAVEFVASALGGTLVGWAIGRAAIWVFSKLDDTMLDIAVNLLSGFAAYLAAERLHVSGVLAAVACGVVLNRRQHAEFTARTRLELQAVWNFVEFVLEALVFMLIGLQLRGIAGRIEGHAWGQVAVLIAAVSATLILGRFVWVYASTWIARAWHLASPDGPMPMSHLAVVSWAGMRGVVSLAAALALPANFPARDIIVLLAFSAILATLVLQGTTIGWLIGRLNVVETGESAPLADTADVRAEMASAALDAVRSEIEQSPDAEPAPIARAMLHEFETRAGEADDASDASDASASRAEQEEAGHRLRLVAVDAARERLQSKTDELDADQHRLLVEELDLEERKIRKALGDD